MCRRYFVWACILIAFGTGILVSLCLEASLVCLLIGCLAIFGGCCLLKK